MNKFSLFLAVFAVSACVNAAAPAHVQVEKPKPVKLSVGKTVEATVVVTVTAGFHIQSNPAAEARLIPTVLNFESVTGVEIGKVVYPPGKSHRLESSASAITTYEGRVEFKVPVVAKDAGGTAITELKGSLRYQACDDKICHFPKTAQVTIPVQK